ncbi:response regulator transcription factor [Blastococcus sp. CT_GayMR16]|uniref:response regulator transcription factor n=1 Tax=Blastococcus sp. CT_GayMR16 TaxID=2559607 RepID=UPI0010746831|nr:response regulator transcription factor [Blastococcus sp. CT_GayMR16]TFV90034.1 response regulator transcription factor [Blastococcus sp. CT_GayMR16]
MSGERPLRVLIADDHPLFRDGMRGLLSTQPDIDVVGEATTGEQAVALAGELDPDLVLMDIQMPGLGGVEATRRVLAERPDVRVLVVTMFDDDATVFTAIRAGARGYVLKDDDKDDVLGAIRTVGRGGAAFGPGVAARLVDFFSTARQAVPKESFPGLTDRERELLHLIAGGASNADIARLLSLTPKTIANYVSNVLAKLHVADRAAAASRAREAGLG